jgi:hypothetical protein
MQPTRVLPAVSVLSLISVEYGGWALLGFLTGRGQLGQFREQFFRAGHAHAGVLLVLSLVYFVHLDRTGYSDGVKWLAGSLLLAEIMAQSPWAREAQQRLSRNGGDAARRCAHRGGAADLGRRSTQERSPGLVVQEERFAAEFMNQDRGR